MVHTCASILLALIACGNVVHMEFETSKLNSNPTKNPGSSPGMCVELIPKDCLWWAGPLSGQRRPRGRLHGGGAAREPGRLTERGKGAGKLLEG